MKLIVGLGNPGSKYLDTRHNVGFNVVERAVFLLEDPHSPTSPIKWRTSRKFQHLTIYRHDNKIILAKPRTYMNRSGVAVKILVDTYKLDLDNLYIIHDDLDLKVGDYKVQKSKGPRDHKGIISIEKHLQGDDFHRVRVGIDNRSLLNRVPGEEYVLQKFTKEEKNQIATVTKKLIDKTDVFN